MGAAEPWGMLVSWVSGAGPPVNASAAVWGRAQDR